MFGPACCLTEASLEGFTPGAYPDSWGVLPQALMRLIAGGDRRQRTVHVSAIEVYQGLAYDLLGGHAPLKVGTKGSNQRTGMKGAAAGATED